MTTASSDTVLLVTNHVPPDRVGAFAALHERVGIELALFGGRSAHATAGVDDPGVPHRHVSQRDVARLAAQQWRAVVSGTAGRVALPAAFAGARRGGNPFVLWTALWGALRSPALLPSVPLMALLVRRADAVVTYGEHVSAHVRARGARHVFVAPQAVDAAFWSAAPAQRDDDTFRALYVGRDAPGKGLDVLKDAWARASLADAELVLVGPDGPQPREVVRNFVARASVLVMPSVPTPSFKEPWGLVANEAMHSGLPVIATDSVGAAAGGLVRDERNGLVVAAGDAEALAGALRRLHGDPELRRRLGDNARRDVAPFTFAAFADGFAAAVEESASDQRKVYR